MLCLGIESSCDDTGLALVEDGRLKASVLASQADLHSLFGGVVPELASREHCRKIGPLLDELLKISSTAIGDLDCVCAARGPGLLGSLLVGVAFAKGLALGLDIPFLGINHLHAHILAASLEGELPYPFLGLLASGGHTCLYGVEGPDKFHLLGKCMDDAAGEAFDKTGKALGLPYPAGRLIDGLAAAGEAQKYSLPRPYLDNDNLDFSFSGLKAAAIRQIGEGRFKGEDDAARKELRNFCASFNEAVAETLCAKTERALMGGQTFRALVLAGGVAANSRLRALAGRLAEKHALPLVCPTPPLCADNGAMIAQAGYLLFSAGYRHDLSMEAVPRGRAVPNDMRKA